MPAWFDIDAANAMVTTLRPVLLGLREDREAVAGAKRALDVALSSDGDADHSAEVRERQHHIVAIVRRMERAVRQIDEWGITLRDIGTGLIDFPALVSGRPVWLCWKLGEDGVGWWHEMDAGMAGRRPLIELE